MAPLIRLRRFLEQLHRLGVELVEREGCGGPGQLATYNMGLNQLCLSTALRAQPQLRDRVLHHELVHVVQDCLDGLDTPTSLTLHEGLRGTGAFSGQQLDRFFLQYLRARGTCATSWPPQRHCPRTVVSGRWRPMRSRVIRRWCCACSRPVAGHCGPD